MYFDLLVLVWNGFCMRDIVIGLVVWKENLVVYVYCMKDNMVLFEY